MGVMLKAENVAIRYITGDFKDIGLKEYTMRRLTGNYQVKEFMAVDGVSFELNEGDMLGIVGSNGAGKSTLLKAVAGIMEPTRGKITANGDIAALLELGSGFDGDLTVKENAYLRGAMLGYTKEFMDSTYEQIIDFAELKEFENRPFKQLSSGMKSRLAFSIASLVKPDILILDEVLSVGDGAFQEKSAKKMREIIAQGATTILVSHSLAQIRELCNKVLWLDHGRQVAFGDSAEVCDRYEAFLRGECPAEMPGAEETEKSEAAAVITDNASNNSESDKKSKLFSGKRIIVSMVLALFCAVLAFNLGEQYFAENQSSRVSITAQEGSGEVTFRGAAVDGVWIGPGDHLIEDGGWAYDLEQAVYTAVNNNSLIFNLPAGEERFLTFNAGPDAGVVLVDIDGEHFEFNLWNENVVELGLPYEVPGLVLEAHYFKSVLVAAFVFLFVFAGAMFIYEKAAYLYFKGNKRLYSVIVSGVLAILFSIGIFTAANPVWGYAGVDSACFMLIGRAILAGKMPYVDLVDNKGPVLYLLNAFPQLLGMNMPGAASTIGIWVLELFFLFLSLRLICWFCRVLDCKYSILPQLVYLCLMAPLVEKGNMCEEYSCFFNLLAFAVALHYLIAENQWKIRQYGFVIGILFALNFLIRPNNAFPVCAVILVLAIKFIYDKEYTKLLQAIFGCCVGMAVVAVPIVLWLAANGAMNDWLSQTLLANMQYFDDSGNSFTDLIKTPYGHVALEMLLLAVISVFCLQRNNTETGPSVRVFSYIVAVASGLSFISAFMSGFAYDHYLLIGVSSFVLSYIIASGSIAFGKRLIPKCSYHAVIILFVFFTGYYFIYQSFNNICSFPEAFSRYFENGIGTPAQIELVQIASVIPVDEEDSVYILDGGSGDAPNLYIQLGLLPGQKLFIAKDRFMRLLPGAEQEYKNYFIETPPKWLFAIDELEQIENEPISDEIKSQYSLVETTSYGGRFIYLYQHI